MPNRTSTSSDKNVLLTVFSQMGSLSPVDRFIKFKRGVAGIAKTPAPGIGDDAIYVQVMRGPSMNVRSKNSAFQIRVAGPGISEEQARQAEKTLAQQVVSKLWPH